VGCLSVAQLRFAGAAQAITIHGELEILSLAGTLSPDGAHLHIAIAGSSGVVIGGHLGPGSLAHHRRVGGWPAAGLAVRASWIRVPVTARKDDAPAADQAAITNVVGMMLFSGGG
jgi:hypothetical protein